MGQADRAAQPATYKTIQVAPLAGALGAEISGAMLAGLKNESVWDEIHRAFLAHSVIVFRDQKLEPADIMAVGGRFGPPCYYPFVTGMADFPYIFEIVKEPSDSAS